MKWMLLLAVVVVVVAVLSALKRPTGASGRLGFPYQRGRPLFSAAERSFLGVLDQAVGPAHRVFGKVRVADIAAVKSGLSNSARQAALNRIAAKHFDFVVCRADDLEVLCAVELNDRSHSTLKARSRDELLAKVCSAIELPLLAITAKATYSVGEIRSQFLAVVAPQATAPAQRSPNDFKHS